MKIQLIVILVSISLASAEWSYSQSTGRLTQNGVLVGTGYSGNGVGLNNPSSENVKNTGPVPKGTYSIGKSYTDASKGPVVMRLTPTGGQNMFGRDGFLIHGDNSKMNNSASEGCIIMSRAIRDKIDASTDRVLTVTA